MQRDIVIELFFPHPPQKVWKALTEPELLSQWFMKNDFKAEVGHHFNFRDKPRPGVAWDGIVYSEVLEVVPDKKLVYTWKGGPKPGVITLDTVLTWTLTPKDNGTLVRLEHRGYKGLKNYFSSLIMEKGYKLKVLKRLSALLDEYDYDQK